MVVILMHIDLMWKQLRLLSRVCYDRIRSQSKYISEKPTCRNYPTLTKDGVLAIWKTKSQSVGLRMHSTCRSQRVECWWNRYRIEGHIRRKQASGPPRNLMVKVRRNRFSPVSQENGHVHVVSLSLLCEQPQDVLWLKDCLHVDLLRWLSPIPCLWFTSVGGSNGVSIIWAGVQNGIEFGRTKAGFATILLNSVANRLRQSFHLLINLISTGVFVFMAANTCNSLA